MRRRQIEETRRSMRRVVDSTSQLARSAAYYLPYGPIDAVAAFTRAAERLGDRVEERVESDRRTVERAVRRLELVQGRRGG